MLKKIIIFALFLLLVPVSLLLAYAYMNTQHADYGWNIILTRHTYEDSHPRVVIDQAHHNASNMLGRYYPFAEMLRMDGCDVKRGRKKFSSKMLKHVDVLVIANASGASRPGIMGINLPLPTRGERSDPAFSSSEIAAVSTWVENGGSLLLIADHSPFGEAAAELAAALGVTMHKGFTEIPNEKSDPMEFSRENGRLPDHPIIAGASSYEDVERVLTFTGQSLDGPADATILLALPDSAIEYVPHRDDDHPELKEEKAGGAQGLAFEYGKGRVVVLGEAAMLTAQVYKDDHFGINSPDCDNQQFALNVIHWLTRNI